MVIGVIKAKLEPKNAGTLFFVTTPNNKVPKPAVNKAVDGGKPTNNGTKVVAPTQANNICKLKIHSFIFFLFIITYLSLPLVDRIKILFNQLFLLYNHT